MLKFISLFLITLLFLCVTTSVSQATLIGVETNGFFMPDVYLTSNSDYLESLSERPWGIASATASTDGHLTVRSTMLSLADGFVYSKSWVITDILNNTAFQNQYFLSLNYTYNLNPGYSLDHLEGGSTIGVVNVTANNVQVANYSYYNEASIISATLCCNTYVEFSGPDQVTASHNIFLGVLDPGESLSLGYSAYTIAHAYEYYSSTATGELYASISSKPMSTPEPSTFILLLVGLASVVKSMKKKVEQRKHIDSK